MPMNRGHLLLAPMFNLGEGLLWIDFLGEFGIQTLETSPCPSLFETKIPKSLIGFLPKIRQKVRKQYDLKGEYRR